MKYTREIRLRFSQNPKPGLIMSSELHFLLPSGTQKVLRQIFPTCLLVLSYMVTYNLYFIMCYICVCLRQWTLLVEGSGFVYGVNRGLITKGNNGLAVIVFKCVQMGDANNMKSSVYTFKQTCLRVFVL